jgi:CBS domain-containing protein
MAQWRVRDVMTTNVITVPEGMRVRQVAAVLAGRGINAVPVVDRFDAVVGVVSWTDLRDAVDAGGLGEPAGRPARRLRRTLRPRRKDASAVEVMSAPPVTIGADVSLAAAARRLHRRRIGRLLVVDRQGRLTGIVTRGDLLKVHGRLDPVIRDEVTHRILHRTLGLPAGAVRVAVDDGVVTLAGRTARRTTALAAVGLVEAVPGVTGVVDRLAFDVYDVDDAAAGPAPRPAAADPLRGWLAGRHQAGRTAQSYAAAAGSAASR